MKINVVCVGKIKEKYFTDAINEYAKRISRFAEFKVIECAEFPVKNQSAAEVLQSVEKEGGKILECVKGYVILTAIDGKMLDSVEISRLMSVKMTEGVSEITFVIGGSNGVSDKVKNRADFKISFGKATYPHQLMRVILSEQIYRAFSREIFAFVKGRGNPHSLIFGGIHARECVTADVVMRLYDNYDESLPAICFVPLVNPDGAMLVKYSLDGAEFSSREFLKRVNNNSTDFSKWKANGRAVDLNVNFDADFGKGESNVFYPAPENYVGERPFSEPETLAMKKLTEKFGFKAAMCLHTKGNLIYYGYKKLKCYKNYVKMIAAATGLPSVTSDGSAGGYKDWFLKNGFGFSITAELGDDCLFHPISRDYTAEFAKILENTPKILAKIGEEIWMKSLCAAQSSSQNRRKLSTKSPSARSSS